MYQYQANDMSFAERFTAFFFHHPQQHHGKTTKHLGISGAMPGTSPHETLQIVASRESLPHPSKLRKKKLKRQYGYKQKHGMDVAAHIAQLKRKQAEFNWWVSVMVCGAVEAGMNGFPGGGRHWIFFLVGMLPAGTLVPFAFWSGYPHCGTF